jgi:hypothetical protein
MLAFATGFPGLIYGVPLAGYALTGLSAVRAQTAANRYAGTLVAFVEAHRFELFRAMRVQLRSSTGEEREANRRLERFLVDGSADLECVHESEEELADLGSNVRQLRRVLADPVLVNWTGHLGVRYERGVDGGLVVGPARSGSLAGRWGFAGECRSQAERNSLQKRRTPSKPQ